IRSVNVGRVWTAVVDVFIFFFSSRRRHTRCYRDWSSDVCSSDLLVADDQLLGRARRLLGIRFVVLDHELDLPSEDTALGVEPVTRDLGANADVVPGSGHGPRQRLDDADSDRRLGACDVRDETAYESGND